MAKPKIPNFRKSTLQHKQRIEQYCALIQQIYDNITKKGAQLAMLTNHEAGEPFSFDDYPMAKEAFSKLMDRMRSDLTATIMVGTSNEWKQSNLVQDLVANKVLKAYTGKSDNSEFKRYYQTNPDALKAFQQRKIAGMNLSTRVWNLTEQLKPELEMAITSAIAPGISAQNLSVEIKQYLNEPDLMFRRFRYKDDKGRWKRKWKMKVKDDEGNVRFVDCDKNTYKNDWTGPGYYKSSSKNAKRLARTEINMAYRTAEQERWKQFDFVVGYEVKTTQNGTHDTDPQEENYKYRPARLANLASIHKPDVCDMLAGKYPKDFHFTGWHPQCLCYAIPILKTEEEFWNYDEDNPEESVNTVSDVPEQFKTWVRDNRERIAGAEERGTLPYFLSDNTKYVKETLNIENSQTFNSKLINYKETENMEPSYPKTESIQYGFAMKLGRNAEKRMIQIAQEIESPSMSDDQKQNIHDLAKVLGNGDSKISPMAYLEADSGNSNPLKDDINCQSVIIAFEARRRGLNCYALPYDDTPDSASFKLGEDISKAWINPRNGKQISPTRIKGRSDAETIEKLEKELKHPGRYILGINYLDSTGHVISVDVTPEGYVILHDEQDGSYLEPKSLEGLDYLELIRIDRAILNIEIVKSVLGML